VDAINDRSLGGRAAEILDPSFIRHDLASCSAITASGCPGTPAAGLRMELENWAGAVSVGGRGCHGRQRDKSWQRWSQAVPGMAQPGGPARSGGRAWARGLAWFLPCCHRHAAGRGSGDTVDGPGPAAVRLADCGR
jgi:hypothetical protein